MNNFILETKKNQINDSASMIPANITFKNFGKPISNVKHLKCCVKLMMFGGCRNSFRKLIYYLTKNNSSSRICH